MLYREDRCTFYTQTAVGAVEQGNVCFLYIFWQATGVYGEAWFMLVISTLLVV